jgi:hypothetical protein
MDRGSLPYPFDLAYNCGESPPTRTPDQIQHQAQQIEDLNPPKAKFLLKRAVRDDINEDEAIIHRGLLRGYSAILSTTCRVQMHTMGPPVFKELPAIPLGTQRKVGIFEHAIS